MAGWQIVADHFRPEEKVLRSKVRQALTNAFPHQAREVQAQFGLFPFLGDIGEAKTGEAQCSPVVLIHGLDDPGWMWRDTIQVLGERGVPVVRMDYPNDGPITDSATIFATELARMRELGAERVAIVAHSMGGLVTRDVLTRDDLYGGDGRGGGSGRIDTRSGSPWTNPL